MENLDTCQIHANMITRLQSDVIEVRTNNNIIIKKLDELSNKIDTATKIKLVRKGEVASGDYHLPELILDMHTKMDELTNEIKKSEITKEKVLEIVDKYKVEINDIFEEYKESEIDDKVSKTNNKLQLILTIGTIISMLFSSISIFFSIHK